MTRLSATDKKEALQNALISFGFPKKYFIQSADARCGHRFALACKTGNTGSVSVNSNFMTYDEFNCYLKGWYDAKMKKYSTPKKSFINATYEDR